MQQGFPITIKLDPELAAANNALAAIVSKTEMWINFSGLKNSWYSDENCVLAFEFTVVKQSRIDSQLSQFESQNWQIAPDHGYAYLHQPSQFHIEAFIGIDENEQQFEFALKTKLAAIANLVVKEYGFIAMQLD